MRTTLDLDEEVLELLKKVAAATGKSAGAAASDLIRCGLAPEEALIVRDGLLTFPAPAAGITAVTTTELVDQLFDELP